MSGAHIYEPTADVDLAPVFRRAPLIGFIPSSGPDTTRIPFVMTRSSAAPNDWQGGRKLVMDDVPGSYRTLVQDLGAAPLTLTTDLLFRDKATFQRFWKAQQYHGQLWMNKNWTMHAPDDEWHEGLTDYAIFLDVMVISPGTLIFDLAKRPMLQGVTFQREDPS